jgi:hypothetical protein
MEEIILLLLEGVLLELGYPCHLLRRPGLRRCLVLMKNRVPAPLELIITPLYLQVDMQWTVFVEEERFKNLRHLKGGFEDPLAVEVLQLVS